MSTLQTDKYFFRDSLFNLVELSLLARLYITHCLPSAGSGDLHPETLAQVLLKMKATENNGILRVAICGSEPVGFYWKYNGQSASIWVHAEHRGGAVELGLKGP